MKVFIVPCPFKYGSDIFVVPRDTELDEVKKWQDNDERHVAWFMKIGNHCECF